MGELRWPANATTQQERYAHAYAAMERTRLLHNTRGGDVSDEARAFRAECARARRPIKSFLMGKRRDVDVVGRRTFVPTTGDMEIGAETLHEKLKAVGRGQHQAVDIEGFTGIDPTKAQGGLPPLPDPYEDFRNFIEYEEDAVDYISVAENTITWTTLRNQKYGWVYRDYGHQHFSEEIHDVDAKFVSGDKSCRGVFHGVQNKIEGLKDQLDNNEVGFSGYFYRTAVTGLYMMRWQYHVDSALDSHTGIVLNDWNYCRMYRAVPEEYTLDSYTDAARTVLDFTLMILIDENEAWRYMFATNNYRDGGSPSLSGVVANLDVNDGAPTTTEHPLTIPVGVNI